MVSAILQFVKAERTGKLALASNISALATKTPHFFSLDRPVTMHDGYQFTLLIMKQLESHHLKVYQEFVAENHSLDSSDQAFSRVSADTTLE